MKFWRLYAFSVMLVAVGCSQAVAPTELNLPPGIPPGATEGEYGFNMNGKVYDSGNPLLYDGSAQLSPYAGQIGGAVYLNVGLFYDFNNGIYGSLGLAIPLAVPKPQTMSISNSSTGRGTHATASFDSLNIYYRSIPQGTVILTKFDTVNNLVSGTFEFTASEYDPKIDPSKTVTITSGYFNDIPISNGSYGQGNVTAIINGTPFVENKGGFEQATAGVDIGRLDLFAYGQGTFLNHNITIQRIPLTTGSNTLNGSTYADTSSLPFIAYFDWATGGFEGDASTQHPGSTGHLTITMCDTIHRRISGSFQFSGTDSSGNVVNITSGKIDSVQWIQ